MKAAPFDYVRAESPDHACRLLAEADGRERKIIAGGQTLVPLMAMRLARPDLLVDINGLGELAGIEERGGRVAIGAMTRQAAVERSELVARRLPLLAKAIRHVGHRQTRNRGTVGGSIVHGDPSAEIPLAATALDAVLVLRDAGGETEVAVDGFFESAMVTAIRPDQLLTEIRFPAEDGPRAGAGFRETASREGDFAVVAAAARIALDGGGAVAAAAVAAGGVAAAPVRLRSAEAALAGKSPEPGAVARALAGMDDEISPETDVHATADYRRRVAKRLVALCIADAAAEAVR